MDVTRDVILDLLPTYLSGEACADTKTLVEAFLSENPELATTVRRQWNEGPPAATQSDVPPDLELKALGRARRLIAWERGLMGLAIFFTAIGLSLRVDLNGSRISRVGLALQAYPVELVVCLGLAAAFWTGFVVLRRRLRASVY